MSDEFQEKVGPLPHVETAVLLIDSLAASAMGAGMGFMKTEGMPLEARVAAAAITGVVSGVGAGGLVGLGNMVARWVRGN